MNRFRVLAMAALVMIILFSVLPVCCEGSEWDCPKCGKAGNTGNYCGICAHPAPWMDPTPTPLPAQTPTPTPVPTPTPATIGSVKNVITSGNTDIIILSWNPVPNVDHYIVSYMEVGTTTVLPYKTVKTSSVSISLPPGRYVIRITPVIEEQQGPTYVMEISVREKTATATPNPNIFRVVTTDEAYIRTRPSTDNSTSRILAQVSAGQYFTAYERVASESGGKDWYRIVYKGQTAYVSTTKASKTDGKAAEEELGVKKGGIIRFGHYPQTAAGKDNSSIEWVVLDVQEGKALLLSQYALDCQEYNKIGTVITWETCTLRTWLNDTFLNRAFTAAEQAGIVTTNVDNSRKQGYSHQYYTAGGNNTQDKVFLLSYAEAWKYLKNSNDRQCVPTAYAVMQEAWTSSSDKMNGQAAGIWWLRSPGISGNYAMIVKSDGYQSFKKVDQTGIIIRPALWVDLNSGVF